MTSSPCAACLSPRMSQGLFGWARFVFGHVYLSTWLAERLGYGSRWKYSGKYETRREHEYGHKITCLLWKHLADRVAGQNIRLIALTQYSGLQTTLVVSAATPTAIADNTAAITSRTTVWLTPESAPIPGQARGTSCATISMRRS